MKTAPYSAGIIPAAGLGKPVGDCERFFVALVEDHQDSLYSGLYRLTGSRAAAQDLTQDVFMAAWKSLCSMSEAGRDDLAARPWLWKIAINLWRNSFRAARRRPRWAPMDWSVADPRSGPEDQVLAAAARGEVADLLAGVPEQVRITLVLRYLGEMSFAEVAAAIGAPEGTVRSRASRGLQLLKRQHRVEVA